ncbi:hypothetical protein ACFXTO_020357 [Malus domestica]
MNVSQGCQICGKHNHMADTCRFRNTSGPSGCFICGNSNHTAETCFQKNANPQMSAMHAATLNGPNPSFSVPSPPPQQQISLTDSGANNHMTSDLGNLSLSTPYPSNETIQTANGEGLAISHDKATGRVLYKGLCNNGLYPIISPSSPAVIPQKEPCSFSGTTSYYQYLA